MSHRNASGPLLALVANACFWPIVLKKSPMVSSAEKYASEIEIFTFGRSFRTQISRSSVQKRRFRQSMIRPFGWTDFFNRIGRYLTLTNRSISALLGFSLIIGCSDVCSIHRATNRMRRSGIVHYSLFQAEADGDGSPQSHKEGRALIRFTCSTMQCPKIAPFWP
jgi:hypothetical protein